MPVVVLVSWRARVITHELQAEDKHPCRISKSLRSLLLKFYDLQQNINLSGFWKYHSSLQHCCPKKLEQNVCVSTSICDKVVFVMAESVLGVRVTRRLDNSTRAFFLQLDSTRNLILKFLFDSTELDFQNWLELNSRVIPFSKVEFSLILCVWLDSTRDLILKILNDSTQPDSMNASLDPTRNSKNLDSCHPYYVPLNGSVYDIT